MLKRIIAVALCMMLLCSSAVFAADAAPSAEFSGSVSGGENINITVSSAEGTNARAFVYTYSVSGAGHCLLKDVEMTEIPSGESKTITITPPEEGYSKKLVVAEKMTLIPLCKSYAYPYMVNVFAEGLGYRLTNVGIVTEGGKTYASNEYEITAFQQGETEAEVSTLSLYMAAVN